MGFFLPIDHIRPNDLVFSHDRKPHPVVKVIRRRYAGPLVGISRSESQILWLAAGHLILTRRRVQSLTPDGE